MTKPTPQNQEFSLLAAIFTTFLCTIFGANAVAIKVSLSGLGVFTTAGLRFSLASVVIFLWAKATGRSLIFKKGQAQQLLIISIIFTVQLAVLYLGLNKTNASRGTLLINLQPFFVLFLAHYFIPGDRMTKRKFLGIFIGFTGVAFVFLEKKGITADFRTGDLMILTTAFLWACNTVYVKTIIDDFDPFHIVLYPMIFSVPLFFLGGFLWDRSMISQMNTGVLASLLYQGLVTASFGLVTWTYMLQRYGAVSLHSFIFVMPVAGVILSVLFLGEPMTSSILIALLLIVSGILIVHFKPKKETLLLFFRSGT